MLSSTFTFASFCTNLCLFFMTLFQIQNGKTWIGGQYQLLVVVFFPYKNSSKSVILLLLVPSVHQENLSYCLVLHTEAGKLYSAMADFLQLLAILTVPHNTKSLKLLLQLPKYFFSLHFLLLSTWYLS